MAHSHGIRSGKQTTMSALAICIVFMYIAPVFVQSQITVFRGATIYPVSGPAIPNGTLLIRGQKIEAVGPAGATPVPVDATVIDVSGKVIIPGLVDTHSHLGQPQGGDRSAPLNPDVRVLDAVDPMSDGFKRALAGGLTTLNIMSGSGHLMSGQTVYIKLRNGTTIEDLVFCDDVINGVCGGMKMANGTNPLRGKPPFPGTRAKSAALARALFIKAQEYGAKVDRANGDPEKMPERDLNMEGILETLNGTRVVHFHTHRHDDVLTAIRLAKEFGFKLVLHHVSEAWKIADEIAQAGVPASLIIIDSPGGKLEAIDIHPKNGAAMEKAGVDVALHTDDGITDSRRFLRMAAVAIREGMSRAKALEALTLAGARMLELDDRLGSLEKGKDADFAILSGDPFSVYTKVEQTWVEGVKMFDLSRPADKAYAVGGYGVYRSGLHLHTEE